MNDRKEGVKALLRDQLSIFVTETNNLRKDIRVNGSDRSAGLTSKYYLSPERSSPTTTHHKSLHAE